MRVSPLALTFVSVLTGSLAASSMMGQVASADPFESAAATAKQVHSSEDLAALLWSQQVNCAEAEGDLRKRQCLGVRQARRASVAGASYLVDVAGPAITVELDGPSMTAEITLRACIACEAEGTLVLGKGQHSLNGQQVEAAALITHSKVFKDLASAEHWLKYTGQRLRAEFVVTLPSAAERFTVAGRAGYKVNVSSYRLYDPCQGDVLLAKPSSSRGPVRSSVCSEEPASSSNEPKVVIAQTIKHPDRLSTAQIKASMKSASALAKECHKAYQIRGMATFKIVIAGNGTLTSSVQSGDFEGTPTGICLDKAIETATFPKSNKKVTSVTYPLMLQ